MAQNQGRGNTFNLMIGVFAVIAIVMVLWYLFKSLFSILTFIAPILLIITFFINRSVIIDYVTSMFGRIKNDTLIGIAQLVGTFLFFPFVSVFLFGKAMLYRKVDKIKAQMNEEKEGEFTEYEELDEDDVLDLKDIEEVKKSSSSNDYDDMFNS